MPLLARSCLHRLDRALSASYKPAVIAPIAPGLYHEWGTPSRICTEEEERVVGLEVLTLKKVRVSPARAELQTLNLWCTPLADAVAEMGSGELMIADNQLRVRVSLTPHVLELVRGAPNLEAIFRDGTWRVTARREQGLHAVLTLEPERG